MEKKKKSCLKKQASKPSFFHQHKCLIFVVGCLTAAVAIAIAIPSPIDAVVVELHPHDDTYDNAHLKSAVKLFQGEIQGPEGFTMDSHGNKYTGLADGRVILFNDTNYTTIVRLGEPPYERCGEELMEHICGRPLGLEIDPNNDQILYIAESYHGIYRYNMDTKELKLLVNVSTHSDKINMMFINDLVVLKNGSIFFTDSSSKFSRSEVIKEVFESKPTGKLLHYNPVDDTLMLLKSGLTFANGIHVNTNEEFLLISETTPCRIMKYHLVGSKAGSLEPFIQGLPGLPDNISPSVSGGLWVAFASTRRSGITDAVSELPWLRNMIVKLGLERLVVSLAPKDGMIVEYNEQGQKVRALYDLGADVISSVSEVLDLGSKLYLGSYEAPYLATIENI